MVIPGYKIATSLSFYCWLLLSLEGKLGSPTYRKTSNRSPRLLLEHFTSDPGLYGDPAFI